MIYSQEVQTAEKKNYVPEEGSIPKGAGQVMENGNHKRYR